MIRSRRKRLGLCEADLADATGLGRRFIHSVEHGQRCAVFDNVMPLFVELGIRREGRA